MQQTIQTPNYPPEVVSRFWDGVRELLTGKHLRPESDANRGIDTYRELAEDQERYFLDAVYNQGEERTAEVIDAGIRDGWPQVPRR
jgi:hypothetical protein